MPGQIEPVCFKIMDREPAEDTICIDIHILHFTTGSEYEIVGYNVEGKPKWIYFY